MLNGLGFDGLHCIGIELNWFGLKSHELDGIGLDGFDWIDLIGLT